MLSDGLGGATEVLSYPGAQMHALRTDVQKLLDCGHQHHFSVLLDWRQIVCSPLAVKCIGRAGNEARTRVGNTCHCDGPPHTYSPGWCPPSGPVTGRR